MFLYYCIRSTWNQLRKFIRTWAFLMLAVFFTIGGLAAYAASWYYRHLSEAEGLLPENFMEFFEAESLTALDALELAAGILVLAILVIQIIGAEKSVARVFMQADANLLFASPRSPQTILFFRLLTTLGMAFAAMLFLLLQVPLFMGRFHLSLYAALAIPLAWCLTLGFSVLLKILVFEVGSRHPFFRKNLRWAVIGLLGVLGLVFYLLHQASAEQSLLLSAHRFFNAPASRCIPVWGWIKGFLLCGMEGDVRSSLLFLFLCLGLLLAMMVTAYRIPADYYEEMLGHTQEIARLLEDYRQEGVRMFATVLAKPRQAETGAGFHYGRGSTVYFYKAVYNRFRFSFLHFFTRTGITYLLVAAGIGLFDRHFMEPPVPFLHVLMLAVMVIFRTIFSPVTEDIGKASFLLQPAPIWGKLFFSLLGGSCNCALDVALPLMLGSLLSGFSPFLGLLYVPVLMSVDFFASATGVFVDVSLPRSIGVTFRQVVQILLLYVGLIFDGMVLISGIADGYAAVGFVLLTFVNLVFGAFFLGLTGVWLYPCSGQPAGIPASPQEHAGARRRYGAVGVALTAMYLAIHLGQAALCGSAAVPPLWSVYFPIYGIGLPVFCLVLRLTAGPGAALRPAGAGLRLRDFLLLLPICFFVMYSGSAVGNLLQGLLHFIKPFPLPRFWGVQELPTELPVLQAFLLVAASPLMEEYIFRRCVIDRVRPYGSRTAVYVSALLFGLFHGTVSQLFYAFLLGLVFGAVYVRTGRLRYTVLLHSLINALSTIVLPALVWRVMGAESFGEMSRRTIAQTLQQPGVIPLLLYLVFLFVSSLAGAVLFLFALRVRRLPGDGVRLKTALSSFGILLFIAVSCLGICGSL